MQQMSAFPPHSLTAQIAEFAEAAEVTITVVNEMIRVFQLAAEVSIAFARAQAEVYNIQTEILAQIPEYFRGVEEIATSISRLSDTVAETVGVIDTLGTAFYQNLIVRTIQARDAFNLFTEGLNFVARGLQAVQTGIGIAINFLNRLVNIVTAVSSAISNVFKVTLDIIDSVQKSISSAAHAIPQAIGNFTRQISALTYTLAGDEGILGRLNQSISAISDRFLRLWERSMETFETIFSVMMTRFTATLAQMQRQLAPVIMQLQAFVTTLTVAGQVLGILSTALNTVMGPLTALINMFAGFARSWYELAQILAEVQSDLSRLGVALAMGTTLMDESARRAGIFRAALDAVSQAAVRALISMQALNEVMQEFLAAGVPAYRIPLEWVMELTNVLAERLGQIPDVVARSLGQWFATGRAAALQQLGIPITEGILAAFRARFGFIGEAPPVIEQMIRRQFLVELMGRGIIPTGAAPAGLVEFVQAMRTLGQQFTALFAEVRTMGGAQLLRQIREEIAQITRGTVGEALRRVAAFITTMIGRGIYDVVASLRRFLATPQVQEAIAGLGVILRSVGAAIARIIDMITQWIASIDVRTIQERVMNIAGRIYALMVAGFSFIGNIVQIIIQFFNTIAERIDIADFLQRVIDIMGQTFNIALTVARIVMTVGQIAAQMLRIMTNPSAILLPIILHAMNLTLQTILRLIPGGQAIAAAVSAALSWLTAKMATTPEQKALAEASQQLQEQVNQLSQELKGLSDTAQPLKEALGAAIPQAFDGLKNAIKAASDEYQRSLQNFQQMAAQGAFLVSEQERMADNTRRVSQALYEFVGNLTSVIDAMRVPLEATRMLVGGVEGAVAIGPITFRAPDVGRYYAQMIELGIAEVRVRSYELWQALVTEGFARNIPEIRQLWERLGESIQRVFQLIDEAIQRTMDDFQIRMERVRNLVTLQIASWRMGLQDFAGAAIMGAQAVGTAFFRIGQNFSYLMQLAAEYPGIERTLEFQRRWNTLVQQLNEAYRQLADVIENYFIVPNRTALNTIREFYGIAVGLGVTLREAGAAFARFATGDPLGGLIAGMRSFMLGFRNIVSRELGDAMVAIRASVQRLIGYEFLMPLIYMWRGEWARAVEAFKDAFIRAFEGIKTYMEDIRRMFSYVTFDLDLWLEGFRDVRSMLADIGAEIALFPIVFRDIVPYLIQMRRHFEYMMQVAAAQGDVFGFRVALENVTKIQRTMMEILGLGGMFLPAYTPEQIIRQRLAVGIPTAQQILAIARGGLVAEAPAFRAVPILMPYPLPAPAGAIFRPDVFGGYFAALAGMQFFTPQMIGLGRGMWFGQVMDIATLTLMRGLALPQIGLGMEAMMRGIPEVTDLQSQTNALLNTGFNQLSRVFQYYGQMIVQRLDTVIAQLRAAGVSFAYPQTGLASIPVYGAMSNMRRW